MRPRVVFFTPGLSIGGAERWVVSLCKHIAGCDVAGIYVAGGSYHASVVAEVRRLGVTLLVPSEEFHCHAIVTWGIPNVRRFTGKTTLPIVEVSHSSSAFPSQVELLAQSAPQATHHVAVSESAVSGFPQSYRNRVTVIENGVDEDRLAVRRDLRTEWGLSPGHKVALFLGRFAPEKGPDVFLDAVRHLPREWVAVMVGSGELDDALQAQARTCGHPVVFGRPDTHVGDLYGAADVVCMSSQVEGHPLVMLEAWLAGVPVVTTPFETAKQVVAEHGPVLDVSTWDTRAIAEAMASPKTDVEAAQGLARERYTATAMGERWGEYIHRIVMEAA